MARKIKRKSTKTHYKDSYTPRKTTKKRKQLYEKGTSYNTRLDKKKKAKVPGKRISKKGNVYYEYRRNRSDKKGTRV